MILKKKLQNRWRESNSEVGGVKQLHWPQRRGIPYERNWEWRQNTCLHHKHSSCRCLSLSEFFWQEAHRSKQLIVGCKTCFRLAKVLPWVVNLCWAIRCCSIATSNTSPQATVVYPSSICTTKALTANSESSFVENEEPHRGRRTSISEHRSEVVALWVLGWVSIDQESHSIRMLQKSLLICT